MSLNTNKHSFSVVYESLLKLHTDKKHTLVTSSNQEKKHMYVLIWKWTNNLTVQNYKNIQLLLLNTLLPHDFHFKDGFYLFP